MDDLEHTPANPPPTLDYATPPEPRRVIPRYVAVIAACFLLVLLGATTGDLVYRACVPVQYRVGALYYDPRGSPEWRPRADLLFSRIRNKEAFADLVSIGKISKLDVSQAAASVSENAQHVVFAASHHKPHVATALVEESSRRYAELLELPGAPQKPQVYAIPPGTMSPPFPFRNQEGIWLSRLAGGALAGLLIFWFRRRYRFSI